MYLILLLFLLGINSVPQYGISTHLKIDTTLEDEVDNGIAYYHNTINWMKNRRGETSSSVQFYSQNNCYIRTNTQFSPGNKPFAISFWVKFPSFSPNCDYIISNHPIANEGIAFMVCDGKLRFGVGDGYSYSTYIQSPELTTNKWIFIVVNRDEKGNLEMYVDNVSVATGVYTGTRGDGSFFYFGQHIGINFRTTFLFDDFIAYQNRVLLPREIEMLYSDSFDDKILINYNFERYNDSKMQEISGNFYISDAINSDYTNDRFHQKEKAGYCNGNDCIYRFSVNDQDVSGLNLYVFTVSFWIKLDQLPMSGDRYVVFKSNGATYRNMKIVIEETYPSTDEYIRFDQNEIIIQAKYISPGVWNHIVLASLGSDFWVFINSIFLGQINVIGRVYYLDQGWEFGKCTSECKSNDRVLLGSIDDFVFYDDFLLLEQVVNMYYSNIEFDEKVGLIAHFPFTENLEDLSDFKHKAVENTFNGKEVSIFKDGLLLESDSDSYISILDSHLFNFNVPDENNPHRGSFGISFMIKLIDLSSGYIFSTSKVPNQGLSVMIESGQIKIVYGNSIHKVPNYYLLTQTLYHIVLTKNIEKWYLYINYDRVWEYKSSSFEITKIDYFRSGFDIGHNEANKNLKIRAYFSELKIFNRYLGDLDVKRLFDETYKYPDPLNIIEVFFGMLLSLTFILCIIICCCIVICVMSCIIICKTSKKEKNIDNEIERKRRELQELENKKRNSIINTTPPMQAVQSIQPNIINPQQVQPQFQPQFQPQVQQMDQSTSKEPVEYIANAPGEFDNQAIY